MFTVEDIESAHSKIKSGADFPKYIKEIKEMGVIAFETWVTDNHTLYFGKDKYKTQSAPNKETLVIASNSQKDKFVSYLKIHQKGETDFYTFCKHCAETGIEKWIVDLEKMTCTYYDVPGNEILVENVPVT